jgi:hypothetical protein
VFVNAGARLLCTSDGVCVIVYVQFSSVGAWIGQVWFRGGGSSLHSGIEFGRSRNGKGSSGGRKKGVVSGVGKDLLGPSYSGFLISLVLGPPSLNSLLWYVPP